MEKEKKIKVEINGVSPLLMHRFIGEDKKARKKQVYVPEEIAEKAAYRTDDGKLFLPSTHFKASMVKASTDFKFRGKKTYKEYIKAGIIIEPNEIILDQQKYTIHEEPVVINRSRVMSWRPRFNKWSCNFVMIIIDDMLDALTLKEILISAGRYKGVGDHRPEYGRFEVTTFEKTKGSISDH